MYQSGREDNYVTIKNSRRGHQPTFVLDSANIECKGSKITIPSDPTWVNLVEEDERSSVSCTAKVGHLLPT